MLLPGGAVHELSQRLAKCQQIPEVFGDCAIRDLGYMASEGRGGTPLVNSGAAGVLNLTSHFFEFIPERSGRFG